MGKINVLSFEIANLIAAGEVVERPSSVLKELIENSIDSGATKIVAEIKKGGVALIRVSDNGCGIEKEDLPVALKRHATSKIKEKDDLSSIMTLGFRGEALAAIASVSSLTIISKTSKAESGTMLVSEAGNVVDISEVGSSDGTTVVVENLFYNVPARRKFLKKDSTEAMNVSALVEKVALSRPDISIQLLIDGEEKFKTPGNNNLIETIYSVLGKDFSSKLIKVEGIANGIKVSGYVGRSDNVRKNRNLQNIFINGRYVKSLTAMAALEKAFTSYIAPECFPTCVLFIEMNPGIVDVNVHPAKLEVKFSDEKIVFESVYYSVKTALEEHEYRPELSLGQKKSDRNALGAFVAVGENTKGAQISINPTLSDNKTEAPASRNETPYKSVSNTKTSTASYETHDFNKKPYEPKYNFDKPVSFASSAPKTFAKDKAASMTPRDSVELLKRYGNAKVNESEPSRVKSDSVSVTIEESLEYRIVGEVFDCYVIVEDSDSVLLIDKHAAHERVIFEDLKKNRMTDGRVASQELLLPLSIILSPDEISMAEEFIEDLRSVGFEYSVNGKCADITAIPNAIKITDAESLFVKMLDEIAEGKGNPKITEEIRREKALYQIACKAAIKGGRVYDKSVIEWLVKKVLEIPDITVCPHGRPIAYRLTKRELDRQFDRIK